MNFKRRKVVENSTTFEIHNHLSFTDFYLINHIAALMLSLPPN